MGINQLLTRDTQGCIVNKSLKKVVVQGVICKNKNRLLLAVSPEVEVILVKIAELTHRFVIGDMST